MNMTTNENAKFISPTDIDYWDNHSTETLEMLAKRTADEGMWIAANHGADNPMAVAKMEMWVAITGALLLRQAA